MWSLPVVFVCENNHYMEYTPIADVIAVKQPAADRAAAYGLAPLCVDGNDVDAVRAVIGAAVDRARNGGGPSLVEAETYRHGGHSAADPATYRSTEEVAQWKLRDPLLRHAEQLRASGVSDVDIEAVTDRGRRRDRADHRRGPRRAVAVRRHRLDGHVERRQLAMEELTPCRI